MNAIRWSNAEQTAPLVARAQNRKQSISPWSLVVSACVLCLAPTTTTGARAADAEILGDPAQVLGAVSCAKCHEHEVAQWKDTPHFSTFETLHRNPEAKEIARRLGLVSVKRNATCVHCHYTQQQLGERVRVVAGVSCESCHGAAKDWVALHNDYGGTQLTKATETDAHRQQRIEASIAAGMNNPSNLYLLARQCLACHTTPNEELVNVGGHQAGSPDFELVSWSQGMVRHNFLRTDGKANAHSTPEQLRVMYVVGIMADLEASLRATAEASRKAPYGVAAAQRAVGLKHRLHDISKTITNVHVQQAVDAALAVELKLNRRDALTAAADTVGKAAFDFATKADGNELAAIDPLLPKTADYKK